MSVKERERKLSAVVGIRTQPPYKRSFAPVELVRLCNSVVVVGLDEHAPTSSSCSGLSISKSECYRPGLERMKSLWVPFVFNERSTG